LRGKIETTIWNFLRARLQEIIVRLNVYFQSSFLGITSFGDVFKTSPSTFPVSDVADVSTREPRRVVPSEERFVERDTMHAKQHFPTTAALGEKELVHD